MRLLAFLVTILTLSAIADDYTVILLDEAVTVAPRASKWRLVVFTADNCGPCRAWKRDHLTATEKMIDVECIDIYKHPETRMPRILDGKRVEAVSRIPTFWLVKDDDTAPTMLWTGARTSAQIRSTLEKLNWRE